MTAARHRVSRPTPAQPRRTRSSPRTASPARRPRSGTSRAPATRRSRASPRTSASTRARGLASRSTLLADYRLDIYRMGYYGGDGARKVADRAALRRASAGQPGCQTDGSTGARAVLELERRPPGRCPATPSRASTSPTSCARTSGTSESHIFFVVRDDDGRSDLLFQTSDTTWQAYNQYGGTASTSAGRARRRAYKVSYNRPFTTRGNAPEDLLFNAEYPMVRWLERNGYDVSYFTGVDSDAAAPSPQAPGVPVGRPRRVLVGRPTRERRGRARRRREPRVLQRQRGVLEDALGEQHRPARLRRCLLQGDPRRRKIDPTARVDRHLARPALQPAGRRRPAGERADRHALHGQRGHDRIKVPPRTASCGSGATRARRPGGRATATLPDGTLGYEWDEDIDNGFRPAGLVPSLVDDPADVPKAARLRLHLRVRHARRTT